MELLSDAKKAAAFINGLIPEDMRGDEGALTPIDKKDAEKPVEDGNVHLLT